ncbi:PH, RCC1 and FYVE domains-containing protein 1 [Tanacetum coccineum]
MELSAKSKKPKLNDVLIWGEGVELGVDALLPKVLDSVSMLDVDKITLAGKHVVLVTKHGEVFCWGKGKSGRGGHVSGGVGIARSLILSFRVVVTRNNHPYTLFLFGVKFSR